MKTLVRLSFDILNTGSTCLPDITSINNSIPFMYWFLNYIYNIIDVMHQCNLIYDLCHNFYSILRDRFSIIVILSVLLNVGQPKMWYQLNFCVFLYSVSPVMLWAWVFCKIPRSNDRVTFSLQSNCWVFAQSTTNNPLRTNFAFETPVFFI